MRQRTWQVHVSVGTESLAKYSFFSQEPPMACEQRPFIASFPHFVQITASVIEEGRLILFLSVIISAPYASCQIGGITDKPEVFIIG